MIHAALSSVFDNLFEKLYGIFLFFDGLVYWCVSELFNVYYVLAKAQILNTDLYNDIANNILTVVGIVMVFYLAYALLKALVNPDDLKTTSKIATNLVISLVLISIVPTIFNYAFKLQNTIMEEGIIDKIVFGKNTNTNINNIGKVTSINFLDAFITLPDQDKDGNDIPVGDYDNWSTLKYCIINSDNPDANTSECFGDEDFFSIGTIADNIKDGSAKYFPLTGGLCGIFLAYIILSFSLDLGIRVFKLAFYQIISPIPILMRIIPEKKSVFDNWLKASVATYLEVFIRLLIMYIVCFFCAKIFSGSALTFSSIGGIPMLIIILGLFAFAKQAPKLIGDAIGINSGNIKLGIGDKLNATGIPGALKKSRVAGMLTGGLGGMATSLANGAGVSGFKYGALNGWKGKGKQFGKQRQDLYKDYGLEGEAGFFGGRAFLDQKKADAKKSATDAYLEVQKGKLGAMENTEEFQKERETAIGVTIDDLKKLISEERTKFEENRRKEMESLEEAKRSEKLKFDKQKDAKLEALNAGLKSAVTTGNQNEIDRLNILIAQEKATAFDSSPYDMRLAQLSNSTFSSEAADAAMAKISRLQSNTLSKADEEEIYKKASLAYSEKNDKYKAIRKYTNEKQAEKDAKKYREEHLDEILVEETKWANAIKAADGKSPAANIKGGEGASAPTPPPSSTSSSSSSTSDKK